MTRSQDAETARLIHEALAGRYADVRLELDFASPLQLLVAALLAAQSTDERVNAITPALFERYPTAADLAAADPAEMEQILRPVGWYQKKTKAVIALAAALGERHGGEVPDTFDELLALPGVGRKTANMVLGNAFGVPAVSVDTHVARVAHRLGWTAAATDVDGAEAAVRERYAESDWVTVNQLLILHGRRTCLAKKPLCAECVLATVCPSAEVYLQQP